MRTQPVTGASRFPVRVSHDTLAVAGALAAVYVFWGSTSPAIKVAVATVPPWLLVGIRFACAGGLLWLWARFRGVPLPSRRVWKGAALSGIVLLVLGNGTFSWCLQYIPSGIGALFFALCPLWNALIGAVFYKERLAPPAIVGILLGLGGMAFLVAPGGGENLPPFPTAVGIATSVAWSVGSMIQRRYPSNDIAQMSGLQMLIACVAVVAIGLASGERLAVGQFTPAAIGALVFLIVFGSIVGFSAFVWVARSVPTVLASTYSYVNPVVALTIATLFLHEPLNRHTIIGAATVVVGVALMLLAPGSDKRSTHE